MIKNKILNKATDWEPDESDTKGNDKKIFLDYVIKNCNGYRNGKSIQRILKDITFSKNYTKESFQHNIIVPLREEEDFFIGTSNKGIYFISNADDARKTLEFYTTRIRSEQKHLRNLKKLINKNHLFNDFKYDETKKNTVNVYFDESGTPSLTDIKDSPFFIVTAIIIESRKGKPIYELDKKFQYIKGLINKSNDFEFKSGKLNTKEYIKVLRELSAVDYEYYSVCFVKEKLYSDGFKFPKSFYKYAFSYLIKNLMDYLGGQVNLYFDQYSNKNSEFEKEFLNYIQKHNLEYPFKKIENTDMFNSQNEPFIQLADLISGVIKYKLKKKSNLMSYIDEKQIGLKVFPEESEVDL